jgi:beta-galactosidase
MVRAVRTEKPVTAVIGATLVAAALAAAGDDATLPPGVCVVWDAAKAYRERTATRERLCLNGLWRWQPARGADEVVPAGRWGFFKVPGAWPGITDYMQKDCQTVYPHPAWQGERLGTVTAAWHQREIGVPADWTGRRIAVSAEYLNSYARVFVDGRPAGEMRYPGGEVEVTAAVTPGRTHRLSLLVLALPLRGVMLSYNDTASARQVTGTVARRGLAGDVWLTSAPAGPRLADLKIDTSTRRRQITVTAAIEALPPDRRFRLRARVRDGRETIREFTSAEFGSGDLVEGRCAFSEPWMPERLWDLHTPQHVYTLDLALVDAGGATLDAWPAARFGFREFWIDGRDFYLNGTRVYLSAAPLDNAQVGAAWASYAGARESLARLKAFGINFVYTHNYGCEPGSHLSFAEVLRAADDEGVLVALSQPHFGHYDWKAPDAEQSNGYARHAAFYVRAAQNHPSVVCYAMSHNATGYNEDMNPDLIDGRSDPRTDSWSRNNARLAQRAEAIVRRLDPARIVYHHSSGNLGAMHTMNFYPNFAPIQELCDWFEHWATAGVKPVFTCEYGAPFTWDWTMYRGWYKGQRSFGSARVPWEFCFAEWNAQFLGDRAFQLSEPEKANLRWEARQFRAGNLWYRWDYPYEIGSRAFDDRYAVFHQYLTDTWRAFRTWGVSALSPWEYGHFWRLRDGVNRNVRQPLPVNWDDLQRPGFSPDYLGERYERMDLAYERSDWVATPAAQALIRNNRPLLAYLAGPAAAFTAKDHNVYPGETVEKQLVVINNSRAPAAAACTWRAGLPRPVAGRQTLRLPTGEQARVPLRFDLPGDLAPGAYRLQAAVAFDSGETQEDEFTLHVLARPAPAPADSRPATRPRPFALFDPKGETRRLLDGLGVALRPVDAAADLAGFETLIIGKSALTVDGAGPDLARVRDGLKVVVFEQTAEALERRLGFRVAEYGLRQVVPRVPDHPLLAGIEAEHLRDWRGEATLSAPRLAYTLSPRYNGAPCVRWCDLEVPRVWRCGCRGNVASVLIEKPARGRFLPILDGGYSLQYSPLLLYREGDGMVLFCQLDVTGRSESDPAAEALVRNILAFTAAWTPAPQRQVLYAGEPAGKRHLEAAGFAPRSVDGAPLAADHLLIVSPGGGAALSARAADVAALLRAGGRVLAVGLDESEATAFLPVKVRMQKAEHIGAYFAPPGGDSPFAGVGPADVHLREPRMLSLVLGGAAALGDGVLAQADGGRLVFCQLAPWPFDYAKQYNLKRTYRRTACLVNQLAANLGAAGATPLLDRFRRPVIAGTPERRWLDGLYFDTPEEMDDPYRFFRW